MGIYFQSNKLKNKLKLLVMKKIVLTLAVIFGLGIAQSNAQNISYGVKADANMSNFLLTDMDNVESNLKIGASLGGFMKLDLHQNAFVQKII